MQKENSTRRDFLKKSAIATTTLAIAGGINAFADTTNENKTINNTTKWDKTFPKSDIVEHKKVSFKNRFAITLVADLYTPKNMKNKKYEAIVLSGPFGAVKEQSSGLYAQELAKRGFVALVFDQSFTGESGGETRNIASPEIFVEDFSAAVDFLTTLDFVDSQKIGAIGICGLGAMALTAASGDSRIKAVATSSMYDMSRSISEANYTKEQKQKVIEYVSNQRTQDAKSGKFALGYHEIPFDEQGNILKGNRVLPETLPQNPHPVLKQFFDYYRTKRGFHERSINSTTAWIATTPMHFFNFPMYHNLELISPRPILMIVGENAHSKFYSDDVYKKASEPKELMVISNAHHVDLYDNMEKIPFEKLEDFFRKNLK